MLGITASLVLVAAIIFSVRRMQLSGLASVLAKSFVTIFAITTVLFDGFCVAIWNPINNQTTKDIFFSWDSMLSNACIVAGVLFATWLALRSIWKRPEESREPGSIRRDR